MNDELRRAYKTNSRYDYVKFRWHDISQTWTEHVREQVEQAFGVFSQAYPTISPKAPKFTIIPASPNKPNGIFIVEIFGFAATLVEMLPIAWMQNLTYAHVKAYARGMTVGGIKQLHWQCLNTSGRRQAVITQGGSAGTSKKGKKMPALRLGSRKSDLHFIVYAREGQAPGFESRWRDEGLAQRTLHVYDVMEDRQVEDWSVGWNWLRALLARDAGDAMFTEFASRGIRLEEMVEDWSSSPAPVGQQTLLDLEFEDETPVDIIEGDAY